jgi:predicted XRE-type DNA-binding protein
LVANLPSDHPVVALYNGHTHNGHARGKSGNDVLRRLRHSKNLTQGELADMLYVTQERVSAMERGGVNRAQIGTLRRYVEALGGRLHIEVDLDGEKIEIG